MDATSWTEFSKWLTSLGVGGAIAALIFTFYRKDVKAYTELWKSQTEMLMKVVIANTESNTRLIAAVESLHRRLDDDENNEHERRRRKENNRDLG